MQPSLSQQTGSGASAVSLVVLPVVPLELVAMLVLEIVGSGVAVLAVDVTVLAVDVTVLAVDGVDVVDVVALLELPSLVAGSLGPKHAPTRTSAGAR